MEAGEERGEAAKAGPGCSTGAQGRHWRLWSARRQSTVAGGAAEHEPRTGAGGREGEARVHTRWTTWLGDLERSGDCSSNKPTWSGRKWSESR